MGIELYKHNLDAYNSVVEAFKNSNRTAVVHPTGSGKSFIGFKLCEDNPQKRICWLSPSEYIFNMQLESLGKISGGWVPSNISYFTYQSIGYMNKQKIESIMPDYIILDEFHRCGAEKWEYHINRLLSAYPNAKILGLSATEIRYLDNDRNMSDEIFDGNIASYMTLGEAIVRDILKAPKYVLTSYSFETSVKKYTEKISGLKNKELKKRGTDILNKLRKALEHADGLDEIFKKNMENPHGKYIVFCSDYAHLKEMIKKSQMWFSKVDESPNIYVAYSESRETIEQLDVFNKDTSDHLRLLYCIDMLNEGIHIPDIDGVILLRPTVSPIIYKQQIGRALSAGNKNTPVIFDIVMNIYNLHCVDDIKSEITDAIKYLKYNELGELIINESFTVIDELLEIKELFQQLDRILEVSWNVMYAEAKKYYEENNNLMVPFEYKTESGYSLGIWVSHQRMKYNSADRGTLTEDRILKLEKIGIIWESYKEWIWNEYFMSAKKYYETNGNLLVPLDYIDENGRKLGIWILGQRGNKRYNKVRLTEERMAKLNSIGMIWNANDYQRELYFKAAEEYYKKHGNLEPSNSYITDDGIALGNWLSHIRVGRTNDKYSLTEFDIQRLDKMGMSWNKTETKMNRGIKHAKEYFDKYGDLDVRINYICDDGYELGRWIRNKRRQYSVGKMKQENIDELESIDMIWKYDDYCFEKMYNKAKDYYDTHGNYKGMARNDSTKEVQSLRNWLLRERHSETNPDRIDMLKDIGITVKQQ